MTERNKIRGVSDLHRETARVRKRIDAKGKDLSGDLRQVVDSVTPVRILSDISGKLIRNAPALYTAYSIFRTIFGKRK